MRLKHVAAARRQALQKALAVLAGSGLWALLGPARASQRRARNERVTVDLPVLAEDGAVVPIHITTQLPGVTAISIVADKNPTPLLARFELVAPLIPDITTRIKLAETTPVRVRVECSTGTVEVVREVRVVQGGCDIPPAQR